MGMSVQEVEAMLDRITDPARRRQLYDQLSPELRAAVDKRVGIKITATDTVDTRQPLWRYVFVPIRLVFLGFGLFYYHLGRALLWVSMQLRRFIHGK